MMYRNNAQEGIPTKNLQQPQNAKDLVSRAPKLAVSAPFTPKHASFSQPHNY